MKTVLGILLSACLCVQCVYAMPAPPDILYVEEQEDTTVETQENEETEHSGKKTASPDVIAP